MNPWFIIVLVGAAIVFALDYLFRRKKWEDNAKQEKSSLVLNMISVPVYVFLSVLGLLWGIAVGSPDTALGNMIYDVTLTLGGYYWVAAIAAAVGSFVLRKIGKTKASIWVNVIALVYFVAVMGVNYLAAEFL